MQTEKVKRLSPFFGNSDRQALVSMKYSGGIKILRLMTFLVKEDSLVIRYNGQQQCLDGACH